MKKIASIAYSDLTDRRPVRLSYPPSDILLVRVDDELFAMEDACNHAGASLSEGPLTRHCGIICPMHGYVFDLRSGKLKKPEGMCENQRVFIAKKEGSNVVIYEPFELVLGSIVEDQMHKEEVPSEKSVQLLLKSQKKEQ